MDEQVLVWISKMASSDDEQAFGKLFDFYYTRLFKIAIGFTGNPSISEEVVCDVFVKLWKNRTRFATVENHFAYLYTAVKQQSINKSRKRKFRLEYLDGLNTDITIERKDPQDILIEKELFNTYQKSIQSLSSKQKLIFQMVKEDGLKYKEVAAMLDISQKTVELHMSNALKHIRIDLKKYLEESHDKSSEEVLSTFLMLTVPGLLNMI